MIPLLALLLNLFLLTNRSLSEESFPTCGDCWCVPGNNGADPCPYSEKPPTEFSTETVQAFLGQTALNPYGLYCNPYKESTCQTSPPQLYMDTDSAVCAFVYPQNPDGSTSCSSYYLQTYRSRDDAYAAGAFITHEGSCGLCSTSIDLAIYLSKCIPVSLHLALTNSLRFTSQHKISPLLERNVRQRDYSMKQKDFFAIKASD